MKEFKDIKGVKLHIFNYSFEDMPNEIVFDLDKNENTTKNNQIKDH